MEEPCNTGMFFLGTFLKLIRPFCPFLLLGSEAVEPRHHPEHSAGSGCRPRHPGAVLRPGEDVLPQHPLLRRGQERGAESLPQHDCRFLRL